MCGGASGLARCLISFSEKSTMNNYKLFDNCRIVVGDEEKSPAGLFSTGGMGENTPRGDFDEVSGDETVVNEQLLIMAEKKHLSIANRIRHEMRRWRTIGQWEGVPSGMVFFDSLSLSRILAFLKHAAVAAKTS